jgi:hypothetical protein
MNLCAIDTFVMRPYFSDRTLQTVSVVRSDRLHAIEAKLALAEVNRVERRPDSLFTEFAL